MVKAIRGWASWIVLAAVVGGIITGGIGWLVSSRSDQRYIAEAVFTAQKRSPDITFVSHSKAIVAEQTARQLNNGKAKTIAQQATNTESIKTKWLAGPNYGELTFRVETKNSQEAKKAATKVFDTGKENPKILFPTNQRPAKIAAMRLTEPKTKYLNSTLIIASCTLLGAITAATLMAFKALRSETQILRSTGRN